ncbi:MAG: hypothetical protein L0215_22365 [Gemmataceae bacterium]|nr:hypothetical protein [Gemmataceae bacterium]
MSQRENNLLWLKDLLDHLADCRNQLEWAQEQFAVNILTETMTRDLDSCRRLCDELRRRSPRDMFCSVN